MPDPSTRSTGFGGIGNITGWDPISQVGSGFVNQIFGGINARRQWRYQKKAMALQQQYALEQMQKQSELNYQNWQNQFDYENAYNDPSKVRDRWAAAGASLAAVLGQSGVGVNATMSGGDVGGVSAPGTPGAPGASGVGPMPTASGMALSQIQANKSTTNRNNAAAARDNAEAESIRDQNLGSDYYQDIGELNKQALSAGIRSAESLARVQDAYAEWQEARNVYKDIIATYDMRRAIEEYSVAVERARRQRAENDVEIPLLDQMAAGLIASLFASAARDRSVSSNLDIQTRDLENWFQVNWESDIDVPDIDKNGKPTGKVHKMSGRQIYEYLIGVEAASAAQDLTGTGFDMWKRKHPLMYSLLNAITSGASSAAGAYVGAKAGRKGSAPQPRSIVVNGRNITMRD